MLKPFQAAWLMPVVVGVLSFAFDQVSKLWVLAVLGPLPCNQLGSECPRMPLIGSWFDFVYVSNEGVAFGLFRNLPWLFTIVPVLICIGAVLTYVFFLPHENSWLQFSLGLIVGGGIGNILDRLRYGYVVDFIRVGWWPVFNVADSAICVGVAIMTVYLLLNERATPPPRATAHDDTLLRSLLNQESWQEGDEQRAGQ